MKIIKRKIGYRNHPISEIYVIKTGKICSCSKFCNHCENCKYKDPNKTLKVNKFIFKISLFLFRKFRKNIFIPIVFESHVENLSGTKYCPHKLDRYEMCSDCIFKPKNAEHCKFYKDESFFTDNDDFINICRRYKKSGYIK